MKWLKWGSVVLGVIILIPALVPFFISLDDYIPTIAASVLLNVSGTLDSPLLYPTGGTMSGAAAGTAVLGRVLGTAFGASVEQWVENLFGMKDDQDKDLKNRVRESRGPWCYA